MVKDVLTELVKNLELEKGVVVNMTIGGVCQKTREHLMAVFKAAGWSVAPESSPFPCGTTFPKNSAYNYVSITLYKPEKSKGKGGDIK